MQLVLAIGRPKRVKILERNFRHLWCKVPKKNTFSRSKFSNFTHLVRSVRVHSTGCRVPPQHFGTLHQWCGKFLSTIFYPFWVENTESEFSAVGWRKRVKKHREKLSAPLVQSSEGKYSLRVKIFEFYPSGPKCRGALSRVQSATSALRNFTPVVRKISLHDFLAVLGSNVPN